MWCAYPGIAQCSSTRIQEKGISWRFGTQALSGSSVLRVWLRNGGVPTAAGVEDLPLRLQVVQILIDRGRVMLQPSSGNACLDRLGTEVCFVSNEFEDEGL